MTKVGMFRNFVSSERKRRGFRIKSGEKKDRGDVRLLWVVSLPWKIEHDFN